jgi:RimJ/RimL family protein N-acetyltransferase
MMLGIAELTTERLILRQWKKSDYPLFAAMNADDHVMKFFPTTLTRSESDEMANKIKHLIAERGWGFWAVEERGSQKFMGFVGLHVPIPELPFSPCVEIGWRLAKAYWGQGYATEAAKEVLNFSFARLNLSKIYAFTPVVNLRSRAVMERLQMSNSHENFEHPMVPFGSPLREHVLYTLTKERWLLLTGL